MQNGRSRVNGSSHLFSEGSLDGAVSRSNDGDPGVKISTAISSPSPPSSSSSSSGCMGLKYIEHQVSKMDTLAGIAIKYGVEVADIKRLNGLVADLQMFAHKSLRIPLPGKHPPSTIQSNGLAKNGEQTPTHYHHVDVESFGLAKSKPPPHGISPAMSRLQGYYGLTPTRRGPTAEGTEMVVYRTDTSSINDELPKMSPATDPQPLNWAQKSRSLANGFLAENGHPANLAVAEAKSDNDAEKSKSDKSVRRRQKAEVDSLSHTPELSLKERGTAFLARMGKGSAPRLKPGSWVDIDSRQNGTPIALGGGDSSVRKSSSTPDLHESDAGSTIRSASKWLFNPESIARPILDGLPKPVTAWISKAARD